MISSFAVVAPAPWTVVTITFADAEIVRIGKNYVKWKSWRTTAPYEGVIPMLKELKKRGKNIAVVSNKFYAATQELCRHFFGKYVAVAIGERENIRKKPPPDTVEEALRQLGASRDGAVYIGDSDVDIETARNCNMPCISVLWGFRSRDFLIEHGAQRLVETPEEILL